MPFVTHHVIDPVGSRPRETHVLDGAMTWAIELEPNSNLAPPGSVYSVKHLFVGEDPRSVRAGWTFTVPDGLGPYRLVDLIALVGGGR